MTLDGQNWKGLRIVNPNDKILFEVRGRGPDKNLGMTELFFEGAEPSLDKPTEPFWRASHSREDRSHAGIGLALVGRLATLLQIDILFTIEDGVFRARMSCVCA